MNRTLSISAVGHASSLFLSITFALCTGFDLRFPEHAMFRTWQDLLQGFEVGKNYYFDITRPTGI